MGKNDRNKKRHDGSRPMNSNFDVDRIGREVNPELYSKKEKIYKEN